jgi:hypothetical protein
MDERKLDLPNAIVYVVSNYDRGNKLTFDYLRDHLPWQHDIDFPDRPICNMGIDYISTSNKLRKAKPLDLYVFEFMQTLNSIFNVAMNSCVAVFFQNGNALLLSRNDTDSQVGLAHPSFTMSFGTPRKITFINIHSGEEYDFLLIDGDLIIISDDLRHHYSYTIKKSTQYTEPAISLVFRRLPDGAIF